MRTTPWSVIARCVCVLLIILHGLISNVSAASGGRILHGSVANPADYKFMMHMLYNDDDNDILWHCTGSVISNNFLLTAAHCLWGKLCIYMELHTSDWTWGHPPAYWGYQCYINENYVDGDDSEADIGLIQTNENLLENSLITKIALPDPGTVYDAGTVARIAGWGVTENQEYADRLLEGVVEVFDWGQCEQIFKDASSCGNTPTSSCPAISEQSFCTKGDPPNAPGVCIGDSGGPVIIAGRLAGVITAVIMAGDECEEGSPSLHTQVSDYIPWIGKYVDF